MPMPLANVDFFSPDARKAKYGWSIAKRGDIGSGGDGTIHVSLFNHLVSVQCNSKPSPQTCRRFLMKGRNKDYKDKEDCALKCSVVRRGEDNRNNLYEWLLMRSLQEDKNQHEHVVSSGPPRYLLRPELTPRCDRRHRSKSFMILETMIS